MKTPLFTDSKQSTPMSPAPTMPIRKQYDRQVKSIQHDVLKMGALVEKSCWFAHQALFEGNIAVIEQLSRQDKQIDRLYRQIEVDCLQLIALQSPVATDLRLIGALMQLIRDLERIGDYAEDLAEFAVKLVPYERPSYFADIEQMSFATRSMLSLSLVALTDLDAEKGLLIKQRDDEVDDAYDRIYRYLAREQSISGSAEPLLLLMLAIRSIERMADHATNIGRRVAYIVTGHR